MLPLGLLLASCTHHTPPPPPVDVEPLAFSTSGVQPIADHWWQAFGDADLDAAVDEALANNFSVRAAFSRLEAAQALVRQSRAGLMPTLGTFVTGSVGTGQGVDNNLRSFVEVGVEASYEIDLWGRIRGQIRGDVARREATRMDAEAAAIALSAAVVNTWIALGATREQIALLDQQIAANEGMAEVMNARFLYGVVRQGDALRQERLLEQTRAQRVERLTDLEVLEHRLAVLLGRTPDDTWSRPPEHLPALPAMPSAGVPLDLIRRRPDVRAAEYRVAAVNADVAVAIADQFPQLRIGGGVSNIPASAQALLTGWVAQLAANLVAPLFEGGRRRAEVSRRKALLEAAVADYGDTLLITLQEVEDALTRNRRQAELLALVDTQADLATRAADGLQAQYTGGLDVTYLDALSARTTAQELSRQQIDARRTQLALRVDLFRALAGPLPDNDDSENDDA